MLTEKVTRKRLVGLAILVVIPILIAIGTLRPSPWQEDQTVWVVFDEAKGLAKVNRDVRVAELDHPQRVADGVRARRAGRRHRPRRAVHAELDREEPRGAEAPREPAPRGAVVHGSRQGRAGNDREARGRRRRGPAQGADGEDDGQVLQSDIMD